GLGFKEYLIHRRIVEAQHLLEETDTKVTTIACEVGFDSISAFNRDFHMLTGITPAAYRKLSLGNRIGNPPQKPPVVHSSRDIASSISQEDS
ncbi:MAG TPA: helix-turn-helix domain-containing protein, partial [Armatimonadota bacterium]